MLKDQLIETDDSGNYQEFRSSKDRQLNKTEKYITVVFPTLRVLESCLNRLNQAWSSQRQDRNMRSKI